MDLSPIGARRLFDRSPGQRRPVPLYKPSIRFLSYTDTSILMIFSCDWRSLDELRSCYMSRLNCALTFLLLL